MTPAAKTDAVIASASIRQSIVTSLRSRCHALLFHCVQFVLELENFFVTLDLLNPKSGFDRLISFYCANKHTHIHIHIVTK